MTESWEGCVGELQEESGKGYDHVSCMHVWNSQIDKIIIQKEM